MDLSGSHFKYADINSKDYGLVFANCDTSRHTSINGNTSTMTVYNERGGRLHYIADSISDSSITFDAEVVTDDDRVLNFREIREIERWLFNRAGFFRLYPEVTDMCREQEYEIVGGVEKYFYLNCRFINPTRIESNSGVRGFKFTVESDSYMLWEDEIEKTYSIHGDDDSDAYTISIDVNSDMVGYVYPKIEFTMGSSGGTVQVVNLDDDNSRITKFVDIPAYSVFTMNGNLNYISGDFYTKFANKNFVRFVSGINRLTITGNVDSVKITWQNRRYF